MRRSLGIARVEVAHVEFQVSSFRFRVSLLQYPLNLAYQYRGAQNDEGKHLLTHDTKRLSSQKYPSLLKDWYTASTHLD